MPTTGSAPASSGVKIAPMMVSRIGGLWRCPRAIKTSQRTPQQENRPDPHTSPSASHDARRQTRQRLPSLEIVSRIGRGPERTLRTIGAPHRKAAQRKGGPYDGQPLPKSSLLNKINDIWRRGWDSNPRYGVTVYTRSRRAPSTTRPPPLQERGAQNSDDATPAQRRAA